MCLPTPRARIADFAGIGLSCACLAHCLALPLLILIAPALSRWLAFPDGIHSFILLLALPAVWIAMSDGWRQHRRRAPAIWAVAGLALLALGLATHQGWIDVTDRETADRILTSIGALCLVAAHLVNWRLRHRNRGTTRPH